MEWDYSESIASAKAMDMNVIEIVSPDTARKWLDMSAGNRAVSRRHIANIKAAMDRGTWDVRLPAYVIFDVHGKLINGHHRLKGIVSHGRPVPMRVIRGGDEDLRKKLDTLTKPRSVSDQYPMGFNEANGNRKSSIVKAMVELEDHKITATSDLTAEDSFEVFQMERHNIDAVLNGYNFKHVRGSRVLSAIAYARPVLKDASESVLQQLISLEGTSPSVASLLRYLQDAPTQGGPASTRIVSMATLRALTAHAYGNHIKILRASVNGTVSGELTGALAHIVALRRKAGIRDYRSVIGMDLVEAREAAE